MYRPKKVVISHFGRLNDQACEKSCIRWLSLSKPGVCVPQINSQALFIATQLVEDLEKRYPRKLGNFKTAFLDVPLLVTNHSENHRRSGTSPAIEEKVVISSLREILSFCG